jgi:hypothetical protein
MPTSILDILTQSVVPRSVTDPVLNRVAQPGLNTGVTEAQLRGFLAGGTQGALDAFTNPVSLATAGAGSVLSRLANVAKAAPEIAGAARAASTVAKAAKPALQVADDLDTQINALTQAIDEANRFGNSMASGPHWIASSIAKEIEPLRQELKALHVIKAARGVEGAQAAAEAADQATFRAARNAAQRAPTSTPRAPSLQIVNPESVNPQDYKGTPEEMNLLIKEMRKRLGLPEETPRITSITGQRTSTPQNIFKK